jgi:hypothetical protein
MEQDYDKSFLGTGWSFPPEFSLQGRGAQMVSAEDDIEQSLRILFNTEPGERIMLPSYGCGLRSRVFDLLSESTVTEIRDLVERAVLFFEPRITVNEIDVKVEDVYAGCLLINLAYTVRATNTRSNLVYPFYLLEATMEPSEHRPVESAPKTTPASQPDEGSAA